MSWSAFVKGLSAVLISVAILLGGGFFIFQFLVAQFTADPPRPTFPNDKPTPATKPVKTAAPQPKPTTASSPPTPSPSPSPKPQATTQARIVLSGGLNVRQGPSADTERVGGVDYSDEVTILETSPDQEWIKVRVNGTGLEGWIKSGYTEPITQESIQ